MAIVTEYNKTYDILTVNKDENGIVTIIHNDPTRRTHEYNDFDELAWACKLINEDNEARVVILTGAYVPGAKHQTFHPGGDVKNYWARTQKTWGSRKGEPLTEEDIRRIYYVPMRMRSTSLMSLRQPIIAMVNGDAVGAGMSLVLSCDIAVAADSARFMYGYSQMGLSSGGSGEWLWARKIGVKKACYLAFTSKLINAQEAKEYGIVEEVVPEADLQNRTYELARSIAGRAPMALSQIKQLLYHSLEASYSVMFGYCMFAHQHAINSEEHAESLDAFINKRKPVYKNPPPPIGDPFTPY